MYTQPQAIAPEGPSSPCTKVCTLDPDGYCIGCLRTGEEIARWLSMTTAEQWQLIEALDERRKHRPGRVV
jgi:uncharacterized protein